MSKEAGGVSRAIAKPFNVNVSENYLEVHLFWAGKGTCCVPEPGYYGPLIATVHAASGNAIAHAQTKKSHGLISLMHCNLLLIHWSVSYSDFVPTVSGIPPNTQGDKNITGLIVGITVSVAVVSLILLLAIVFYKRKKYKGDEKGKKIDIVYHL